ncbi:hypothetical protein CLAFUW4_02015 [Fulvia fulva]|nr:hypothetical protein CLAFUR4_02011 [Fulvia fulva]WPV09297.1 hypothetical protein CLAFUW4_02015 [Fulvia fulva]WPV23295.1 hypothetical protein CLAFUW7_02015 [Fulvia fulva]
MLHKSRRSSKKTYTALSYCWGSPESVKKIDLDGFRFGVTLSLWQALSTFAASNQNHTDLFWIDALCINQDDVSERNHQVQNMGQIYSSALVVYAWLGPRTEATELVCYVLQLFAIEKRPSFRQSQFDLSRKQLGTAGDLETIAHSLMSLMATEYFYRVWIIPETARAERLMIICGEARWDLSTLYEFTAAAAAYYDDRLTGHSWHLLYQILCDTPSDIRAHMAPDMVREGLYICLWSFLEARCQDKRDHVFAMAGHPITEELGPLHQIKVDYALTDDEVLITAMEWMSKLVSDCPEGVDLYVSEGRMINAILNTLTVVLLD